MVQTTAGVIINTVTGSREQVGNTGLTKHGDAITVIALVTLQGIQTGRYKTQVTGRRSLVSKVRSQY